MAPSIESRASGVTARRLAALWSSVLESGSVEATDDFFDRGGHSLTGFSLTRRIEEAFGVGLSLADLYQHRTLAAQVDLIDRKRVRDLEISIDFDEARYPRSEVESMSEELLEILRALADALDPGEPASVSSEGSAS